MDYTIVVNETLISKIRAEGFNEVYDPFYKCRNWIDKVNSDISFNKKILSTLKLPPTDTDIKDGVSLRVELWFSGKDILCVDYIFIDENLLDGNRGPYVTSMGSVISVGEINSNLCEATVNKLTPLLIKIGYIGPISIDCTVKDKDIYIHKLLAGFSYSSIFSFLEIYKGKVGSLINSISTATLTKIEFKSNLAIAIDLSVLPFPVETYPQDIYRVKIQGLNIHNLKHFWGYDVGKEKDNNYYTTGKGGRIGTITARGDDIAGYSPFRDAKRRAMRTLHNLAIPGLIYRLDIGQRYEGNINYLKTHSWL